MLFLIKYIIHEKRVIVKFIYLLGIIKNLILDRQIPSFVDRKKNLPRLFLTIRRILFTILVINVREVEMDFRDREKLKRLEKTLELNYRITRLYANYLENYNEIISSEMIEALCGDGEIEVKDGLVAILCQIFGLDIDGSQDERMLIRDYITPSVRVMDAARYRNNPYYKNIVIPEIKKGRWELRRESYPAYRGVIAGDIIFEGYREIPPLGFFSEEFEFPAVLEDGNEWMTLTPVDLDTSDEAIDRAYGRVVTFGLGL